MKKIFTLILIGGIGFSAFSQDWTQETSKLFYWSKEGKVFIEPDHTSVAIYFRDVPTKSVEQNFNQRLSQSRVARAQSIKTEIMGNKGMMRIEDAEGLVSLESAQSRQNFLTNFNLDDAGAYDLLPAFQVDGMKAWLTKRVIIRLNDGVDLSQIQNTLNKYDGRIVKTMTDQNTFLVQVDQIENQLPLIQEVGESGLLDWGEPDFKMEIVKFIDPNYQYQWHLNNTGGTDLGGKALLNDADIDAPEAWSIALGNGVTVAVIDDGLENHEDMAPLLNGYTPANGGNGTPSTSTDGHGQQCAGLIGALHNEIGVRGVSPGVNMFSVNIFAPGTSNADVADGINWAVNNGADVLSNSWGFTSCTASISSITAAFNNAAINGRGGLGCIILVASGNDFNTCVSYPADLPSVTAVGGISGDGQRSNFSNYGPALDIVAPSNDDWQFNSQGQLINTAHDLVTIDREGSAGWFSGNYSTGFGGTSGATPIAAGVAALVLSVDPSLTKAEVENILYTTTDDAGPAGFDNEYGHGRVNAYQAVLAAGGSSDTQAPTVPNGLTASNIGSSSFDVSWNASSDDTGVAGYNVFLDGSNIGSVTGTSTSITGLNPSTSYSVRVSAFDAASNESGQSSALNVTTSVATVSCASTVSSFPYTEGFESGAGWTQVGGDDGNWTRDSAGTPSSNTGPSSAIEGSFYMYTEASTNGLGSNATVILESPCYDLSAASSATFSFQNHMYGSNIGSLSLEATTDDQSWSTLWSLSGNQGNQWNEVDVSLDTYVGSTVKLRFVGVTGSSWQSDITIDALELNVDGGGADTEAPSTPTGVASSNITTSSFDLSWNASSDNVGVTGYNIYLDGSNIGTVTGTSASVTGLSVSTSYSVRISAIDAASNESAQSAPINVTTNGTSISCSSTVSGFPYSEGFESNDGWTQITGDDGNWLRDANGTPSSGTGPSSAVQGSFYMFLEASTNGSTGQLGSNATAILESPCFDLSSESSATFSFEYHMYGTSVGSLAVQASTDGINWSNIWSLSGNQGNSWQSVNLDLASYLGSEVKLRMVGTTGSSWSSDIAIDDLSLTTGSGGGTTTVTLTIVLDNYPEETSWEILDGTTVVASGGTYGSQPDGSTVVENIDLSSGCYDFVIRDTYGDGICCSYGNGSYSLTDGGTTLASGGSFGSSETTNFCINGGSFNRSYFVSSTSVGVPATFDIYPNPVVGDELKIESTRNDISYSVMNLSGQLVSKGRASGKSIDVSQLGAGLYTIQLESNGKSVVRKFVKQ